MQTDTINELVELSLKGDVIPQVWGDYTVDDFLDTSHAYLAKLEQWKIVEDLQEKYPYLRFGWYGFIPMVYEDDMGTAKIHMA